VVIIVAIGQGVKQQVVDQISQLGSDVVSVRSGKLFDTDSNGRTTRLNVGNGIGTSTLTEADITSLKQLPELGAVTYGAIISGVASNFEGEDYNRAVITATPPETFQVLGQELEFGEFYTADDVFYNTAIIGSNVAIELFEQRDPIGRLLNIGGEDFTVRGILTVTPESPMNIGVNFNDMIYIPVEAGQKLTNNSLQISVINVKVADGQDVDAAAEAMRLALLKNHSSQEDFTVIKQSQYLEVANQSFNLLTTLVAAIAGISLFVGGIGIMNIMLVGVSERTHEIGVRKAIGASNQQILGQFLVEAIVISVLGGVIGIALSWLIAYAIRLITDIHPLISITTILIATAVSTFVGIIFGMMPAVKAASKDPIEALRHE
jgi:ABC-type antimicrobial peptide transport system permease subunit